MAHGWVKSMQCRSRALEDVHVPSPRGSFSAPPAPTSSSCRSSSQAIKDVVDSARGRGHKHGKPNKPCPDPPRHPPLPESKHKPKSSISPAAPSIRTPVGLLYPALTELPEGHPSRKVVEIIFHTGWGPKPFPGRVEMIFKVQNGPRTNARFEEYREAVKSRAGLVSGGGTWEEDARCAADGNEVMRFHTVGPLPLGGVGIGYAGAWGCLQRGKTAAICTFAGSGQAHESAAAAGGGSGRRAMLVCRVIAGRVAKRVGEETGLGNRVGFDSVGGENGKLLVYDSRAVLPCFLIFYRL